MQTDIRFARRTVTATAATAVDIVVDLVAPPAVALDRPPVDMAVVIDRSGSMAGEPLAQVKAAVIGLSRLLGPEDRLAVVAFDGTAEVVLSLGRHDSAVAERAVAAVQSGGNTNLSGGWLEGLRLLTESPREPAVRRVVTLTDGHANAGVTDRDRFATLVHQGRAQGVTSSFIGFDDGYDEELLAMLADSGGGDDYWCDGPDKATEVFATEFGGLARVVAQNLTVGVAPVAPVSDVGMIHDLPVVDGDGGGFTVSLGDTYGDERRSVALRIHVPAGLPLGAVEIARLTLGWADVGGEVGLHSLTVPVVVTVSDDPELVDADADPSVAAEIGVIESAKAQRAAAEAADRGDWEIASDLFEEAAASLTTSGADPAKVAELRAQAQRIQTGDWTMRDKKMHFSSSRSAMRKRNSSFRDSTRDDGTP